MRRNGGFTLIEALAVVAMLALAVAIAAPNLEEFERRSDLIRLARQISADALRCRMEALTSCRNVGLVFDDVEDRSYYVMVADGDNDGVSRADFVRGVDKPLGPKVWVHFLSAGVRLGIPSGWKVPDPAGGGTIEGRGLRIGSSGIISFSRTGGATPSSVYFNDGRGRLLVVRINGEIGRVRALVWSRGWDRWREVRL
ncbi:MAG TPA: prepilin-type N-terminal cleavage/methylation domain-containing protein [Thermoanaerobaculaceae bacterium]|nr:prepilin-type N-terminal cleavage/methylation domain-containing protein [Thermoanaerobaculaceae bacterium]